MHKEEAAMKKIGMLTSGGDCQALNAATTTTATATTTKPIILPRTRGDANMDGEVDSQDVFELLLYIARTAVGEKDVVFHEDPTVNRWLILMMDINNDNKLDSQDLYYLLLYIAMHGAGIKATWSDVLKN